MRMALFDNNSLPFTASRKGYRNTTAALPSWPRTD